MRWVDLGRGEGAQSLAALRRLMRGLAPLLTRLEGSDGVEPATSSGLQAPLPRLQHLERSDDKIIVVAGVEPCRQLPLLQRDDAKLGPVLEAFSASASATCKGEERRT